MNTIPRSLLVIDDGTGNSKDGKTTFAEFKDEDAIIILGDPGMGKTTLFKDLSNSKCMTVRNFLVNPSSISAPLFLDALDEYRNIASGQDVSSELAKELCSLGNPKFRLSCRAADWFGSTDIEVLKVASASGRVVVLELCPLSRNEILKAVEGVVNNPENFWDETNSAGLGKLLGNPQTLELFAKAWGMGKKPINKFEAFDFGISELIKELNPKHIARGEPSPDPIKLRKAAGAAAAIILLSNSVGISRSEPADLVGFVKLSEVPTFKRSDLGIALKRRLFASMEVDRFEFIHRTIAEFLAAEDLSHRIKSGLPIERVVALMCGIDGKPISSLRGLFAWLMCNIGSAAESYVERDPYGVVTYGDPGVLAPNVQSAVWTGLNKLRDPWFLTNEDDRGSFGSLANKNTANILKELLIEKKVGAHLKIAILEAIANSKIPIGLTSELKALVMNKKDNSWVRSTALKAYANSIQHNSDQLEALDTDLIKSTDDRIAHEIRIELLMISQTFGKIPNRIISILEQAASSNNDGRTVGRLYPLKNLPKGKDLDEILDNVTLEMLSESNYRYEFARIVENWLSRRLESSAPLRSSQLSKWLRNIRIDDSYYEKSRRLLKTLFEKNNELFKDVFNNLSKTIPKKKNAFWLFLAMNLWKSLPRNVWPIQPYEFFLACAEKEQNVKRSADYFQMYLSTFPAEGASVEIVESGLKLMERRKDVASVLGNWKVCKIDKWRKSNWKRKEKKRRKELANREYNIQYLSPRLGTIKEGLEESALVWAIQVYLGYYPFDSNISDPRERLLSLTNDEITDALITGFSNYLENPNIPDKDAILEDWAENSIPYTHLLLSLSVYFRHRMGQVVPEESIQSCIAAVVTNLNLGDTAPDYNDVLQAWFNQVVLNYPEITKSILKDFWVRAAVLGKMELPVYYELRDYSPGQDFLVNLSAEVLETGINENTYAIEKLTSTLLAHDHRTALDLGAIEINRQELSPEVRVIWVTVLFVLDPIKYLDMWRNLTTQDNTVLWSAIEVITGSHHGVEGIKNLTPVQRAEIIMLIGKHFPNASLPRSGWSGSRNPWDASRFVGNQIQLLSADGSSDAGIQLGRLENDPNLKDYHEAIRHNRAQYEKQQREKFFSFASPQQIADAIQNKAPANPLDLLNYVVDHFNNISHELTHTQRERYRAYWNEKGRNLIKPKHEEVCSGLLAEDLQHRVQPYNLIVTVEHHMVNDKECDIVVLQGVNRILPIEVKHHYHRDLWKAWETQLDHLYSKDVNAGGLGIYLIIWSGEVKGRKMPKIPNGVEHPTSAIELKKSLESLIPDEVQHRLRIVAVDISVP